MSGLTKEFESISVSSTRHDDIFIKNWKKSPNKERITAETKERIRATVTKPVVFATLYSNFIVSTVLTGKI